MKIVTFAVIMVVALAMAGCASNAPAPSTVPASSTLKAELLGDGSTFVQPLAQKWGTEFQKANAGVQISYTGGGSGKGRGDITQRLVDFAGSDAPMKDSEIANATDILHIPIAAGAVTIAYNLEGVPTPLRFDGATIGNIFLGKITMWNDDAIRALNPGVTLPAQAIQVVHRSDGSGTTATFTDYLSKVSPDWRAGPGAGSTVNWPVGTGASGNNGVGAALQQTPDSIAYIGSEWTQISKIQTGLVKNKAGNFVAPTTGAVSAAVDAALGAGAFDERLRGSVTDQDGADSYPISAVTWVLVHQHQADAGKGQALAAFVWYMLHDGQKLNEGLNYAKVPASLVTKAEAFVSLMDSNGAKLR